MAFALPYFLLASNGPMMQAWFSRRYPGRSPYRLYALSNVASLLALVSYPVLVEPWLAVQSQAQVWSWAYVIFAACAVAGAVQTLRKRTDPSTQVSVAAAEDVGKAVRAGPGTYALWIALPACASVLLLATTSQLTQEVAAIPFLWVLPLVLYLLSFILCFASGRLYVRPLFAAALAIASGLYVWVYQQGFQARFTHQIAIYSLLLFVCCMVCHGEMVRIKPHPRHLTAYYLMISVGGAIGGLAVNLVAPSVFGGFWELQLGLFGCWALLAVATVTGKGSVIARLIPAPIGVAIVGVLLVSGSVQFLHARAMSSDALQTFRNFYGILEVSERNAQDPELHAYRLYHGATLHGIQYAAADRRHLPTTYYTEDSGVGLALLNHPKRPDALRVGVLGLGIGTLAAYGQPGDVFRFYEINSEVVRIAEGAAGYFSYLADCPAQVDVVLGDARVSLEQELARGERQRFDVLVLDTFSSDSIPVHLLTREAVALYLEHLAPGGVVAMHISNRYLDLRPVVWEMADYFNLDTALISASGDGERQSPSVWVLATRDGDLLERPAIADRSTPRQDLPLSVRLWTDDYSNLFQILR